MINIIKDKPLIEDVFNFDVVLFPMGINNSMNRGFVYDISLNFPLVLENENETGYGDRRKFGRINETTVEEGIKFVACYVLNYGLLKKFDDGVFIDYDCLEECLRKVVKKYDGKKIVSPIIGCDKFDGNGDYNKIINTYDKVFLNSMITLYDFQQKDYRAERFKEAKQIRSDYKNKIITLEEYKERKKNNEWRRKNGIFKPMPNDFTYIDKRNNRKKK